MFTIYNTIKYFKVLRDKSDKDMQDLFTENYQAQQREIKEDLNKWKDVPCSGVRRFNMVRCPFS